MEEQIKLAISVRKKAYSPYSNFSVGCCLKTKSENYYTGCNIENDGIQSICAERVAFAKAISEGEKEFESIVIVGAEKEKDIHQKCLPCGYCRQFMNEFVDQNFKIYSYDGEKIEEYLMEQLLPESFRKEKC